MLGNRNVILQPRDLHLLRTASLLRAIDRKQATIIGNFGSVTRVNATLLRLVTAKFLNRFFLGVGPGTQKAIYTITPKGAAVAEVPYRRLRRKGGALYSGDLFLEHQLLLNDLYLALISGNQGTARSWETFEQPLPQSPVIPDAYFELVNGDSIKPVFLEVDRGTEPKKIWKKKVAGYLSFALSGAFERNFKQAQFRVLIITTTEQKLKAIREVVASQTTKIFWLTTFSDINREGIFAPIWLRPIGVERQSLL
jgi:hypothetical protein